jgi:hypothetical protein
VFLTLSVTGPLAICIAYCLFTSSCFLIRPIGKKSYPHLETSDPF